MRERAIGGGGGGTEMGENRILYTYDTERLLMKFSSFVRNFNLNLAPVPKVECIRILLSQTCDDF